MLEIIQGDTHSVTVTAESGADLIEELYFTSKYLGISQRLAKINDTQWLITFDADFTCDCKVCLTSYDITAKLKDNQVNTVVYEDKIRILKKENTIDGN